MKKKLPLSKTHPKLAKEAYGWDPSSFTFGSNRRQRWLCPKGHSYLALISRRTAGDDCPICSGHKVLAGFNDLKTTHPEIASWARGWDPTQVRAGSQKKMQWKCPDGHIFIGSPEGRKKSGCPICSNRQVLAGFNDLATTHPDLAKEADGWDPTTVIAGSGKKRLWKCSLGHTYLISPNARTGKMRTGCAVCANKKVLPGFNDLATTHPELAKEADGWDPTTVIAGSSKRLSWVCPKGHSYVSILNNRSSNQNSGCPVCANKIIKKGFNDFASTFPELAKEANGWDPTLLSPHSGKKLSWKCSLGHIYEAAIYTRNVSGKASTCPICSNRQVLAGFNDLATTHPELAKEADGWDPSTVLAGSGKKLSWKCPNDHSFRMGVNNRTGRTQGCPSCAKYGYDVNKDAYLYFLEHSSWEMLQIGITNSPKDRLQKHRRIGWELLEIRGPMDGLLVKQLEASILQMLTTKGADLSNSKIAGKFDGYSEAWSKSTFEVRSIKELMKLTDEFEEKESIENHFKLEQN